MKQARTIKEALEVQNELASVRTEIERLEGKRRFLANQSSLSTVTIRLEKTAPLVTATKAGFGDSVKLAIGDAVDFGAAIITGIIRLAGVLTPILILLVLPGFAGYRLFRRFRRAPAMQTK